MFVVLETYPVSLTSVVTDEAGDFNICEDTHEELLKAESEWVEEKKELELDIKNNVESIEEYLGKIQEGHNYTSNIDSHLDNLKEIFNTIEDRELELKLRREDLEDE